MLRQGRIALRGRRGRPRRPRAGWRGRRLGSAHTDDTRGSGCEKDEA